MSSEPGTDPAESPEPIDLLVQAGFLCLADGERDVILDDQVAVRDPTPGQEHR